ncbi:MAG: hypothetical protein MJZ66_10120 [Bacteroidales bacterium]|nr:hypothetical protein [Bacteroidales bacterium]
MKKILTSTLLALCTFTAMAQVENEPEKGFVVSVYDTDGDFTNVRNGAGGAVIDKLKTRNTYNFVLGDGISDQNGWVKIPNGVVYKYDDYGESEGEPISHFETKLKASATGHWVHNSVLQVYSKPTGVIMHVEPNKTSAVGYEISYQIKLHPIKAKGDWLYCKTWDGKHQGWIAKDEIASQYLMYYPGDRHNNSCKYITDYKMRPIKVNGNADIEGFVDALGLAGEYGWGGDPIIDNPFDKANGYFHHREEGDGSLEYWGAYWNRKDGKKMFLLSICDAGWCERNIPSPEMSNEWFTVTTDGPDDMGVYGYYESGCMAYLYNPTSKKLEPMKTLPFNGMPATKEVRRFKLPQHGKDITVDQHDIRDREWERMTEHTLKFNGLTFDWVE